MWNILVILIDITILHAIHPDIAAFSRIFAHVLGLLILECISIKGISREHLGQFGEVELRLRMLVVPKYDLCGMGVGGVVDRQATEHCQHLACGEILFEVLEHGLGGPDVVLAI